MTIFISNSTRPRRALAPAVLALALVSGCGEAGSEPSETPRPHVEAPEPAPVAAAPTPAAVGTADVAALYTADLEAAVAGAKKRPFTATGDFGGMTCSPGRISGTDSSTRALTLTLPKDQASRHHALAVVTPERGLLELYSPYGDASESEDIVVPSHAISWSEAREQNIFVTNTDKLDGLRPGSDAPEVLFLEPGRYRFALVNGIDAALLRANGTPLKVTAACSFDWTP